MSEHILYAEVSECLMSLAWYKRPMPLYAQLFGFAFMFILSVIVLAVALIITNGRMPDPASVRPLPDVMFEILPRVRRLEIFTDVTIFFLLATTKIVVAKLYFLLRKEHDKQPLQLPWNLARRWRIGAVINRVIFCTLDSGARPHPLENVQIIIGIRFLATYTVMMLYRSLVITMTSYPATDNQCQHPKEISNPALNIFLTVVTLGSGAIHCGDLMFSGHTIIICLCFLIIWEYGVVLHRWALRAWGLSCMLFSFFCIISSRSHYTDDILVAAYGTIATYLVIGHCPTGAPWQLQFCIRWWPSWLTIRDEPPVVEKAQVIADDEMVVVTMEESTGDKKSQSNMDTNEQNGCTNDGNTLSRELTSVRDTSTTHMNVQRGIFVALPDVNSPSVTVSTREQQ